MQETPSTNLRVLTKRFAPAIIVGSVLLVLVGGMVACSRNGSEQATAQPRQVQTGTVVQPTQTSTASASQSSLDQSQSTGITRDEAARIVPLAPAQVIVEEGTGAVNLRWPGTGEDVKEYIVFRRAPGAKDWQSLGSVQSTADNMGWYEFKDGTGAAGDVYTYGVRAVSPYGTESATAESVAVTVR